MLKKRCSYTSAFKRQAIRKADVVGNRKAAEEIGVDETQVRRWRADRIKIFACEPKRRAFRRTNARYPLLEDELEEFVKGKRKNALPVTAKDIRMKALEIATRYGLTTFKASRSWIDKFMRRKGFSLRRRTTICQKLPPDFEQKLVSYQGYLLFLRKKYQFLLSQIGNADETPIWLDMPRNYTVNEIGSRQVPIKTSGYEKQRVTVMLCITADGHKLPPYIIFKRKTIPKPKKGSSEAFPPGVIIRAQTKGWMTEELMQDWLEYVWAQRPGGLRKVPSLLILDAFRGHLTESVKNKVKELGSQMAVIPGGMTSQLQPLDVCVNKPFKDLLREQYEKWLASENLQLTPAGKIKKASPFKVAEWVKFAWDSTDKELVRRSFLKCCVSNALDGSEDDVIFETEDASEKTQTSDSEPETDDEEDSSEEE